MPNLILDFSVSFQLQSLTSVAGWAKSPFLRIGIQEDCSALAIFIGCLCFQSAESGMGSQEEEEVRSLLETGLLQVPSQSSSYPWCIFVNFGNWLMSQMAEVRASIECAQHQKLCVVLNIQEILFRIVLIVLLVFWFMIMYG